MDSTKLLSEVFYKAVKSSGPGGQHVNKTATKVVLTFNIGTSQLLSDNNKELLLKNLENRLNKKQELILQCDSSRSQYRNKVLVNERFLKLISENLNVEKTRVHTVIPKSIKIKRLKEKRLQAQKKSDRKSPEY